MDEVTFAQNNLVLDATIRNFEVLGEAAKHIPESLRRHYRDSPWQKIVDLRNWVAHDCAATSPSVLYQMIRRRFDPLEQAQKTMLDEVGD